MMLRLYYNYAFAEHRRNHETCKVDDRYAMNVKRQKLNISVSANL